MSAETLRRAAAAMRERAEAATPGPWRAIPARDGLPAIVAAAAVLADVDESTADAEHIASWHPTVALAVADWLDRAAIDLWAHGLCCDIGCMQCDDDLSAPYVRHALTVARAYLGDHP